VYRLPDDPIDRHTTSHVARNAVCVVATAVAVNAWSVTDPALSLSVIFWGANVSTAVPAIVTFRTRPTWKYPRGIVYAKLKFVSAAVLLIAVESAVFA
jgi:hypothetical protein